MTRSISPEFSLVIKEAKTQKEKNASVTNNHQDIPVKLLRKKLQKLDARLRCIMAKKEVDYQFFYPGTNNEFSKYKHIKDQYLWDSEDEGELVYSSTGENKSMTNMSMGVGFDTREEEKKKHRKIPLHPSDDNTKSSVQVQSVLSHVLLEESSQSK